MSKDKETLVKYLDGKVQIKSKPLAGENIPVYVRPGDKIDLELLGLNLETAKFKLVGGDLILAVSRFNPSNTRSILSPGLT
jgi:hypothetical protein